MVCYCGRDAYELHWTALLQQTAGISYCKVHVIVPLGPQSWVHTCSSWLFQQYVKVNIIIIQVYEMHFQSFSGFTPYTCVENGLWFVVLSGGEYNSFIWVWQSNRLKSVAIHHMLVLYHVCLPDLSGHFNFFPHWKGLRRKLAAPLFANAELFCTTCTVHTDQPVLHTTHTHTHTHTHDTLMTHMHESTCSIQCFQIQIPYRDL